MLEFHKTISGNLMLRFSASTAGDMNIENLRTALFNYILSVQKNEGLIIRIEDTDKEQAIEGKDQEIIGLLDLFGVKYKDVIYQSASLKYHRAMALQLLHEKIAFNCFCTKNTLNTKKEQAKIDQVPYRYDDACLSLTPEETIDREDSFTVRLRKPNVDVEFTDIIKGDMKFSPHDIDSFIILRADKSPSYNFACAIDDMIADISMVIRSENHLSDTPKQIVTRAALNYTKEIIYAHFPSLISKSGEETMNVKWLLEQGFIPAAIINYLLLIGNDKAPQKIFELEDAIKWFDLCAISKEAVTYDVKQLRSINTKHLNALDDVELSRYVGFADKDIGKLAKLYLDEVSTTKELKVKIAAIFSQKNLPENMNAILENMKNAIQAAPYFDKYDAFKAHIMKESDLNEENFIRALRLLLTGCESGPEPSDMYAYLKNYLPEIIK